ncbi:MAG TPA: hypothetical protein VGN03_00195 [Steroidobacteraceae bacterium]
MAGAAAGRAAPDLEAVPAGRAGDAADRGAAAPPVMGAVPVPDFTAEDPGWTPAADAEVFG